MESESRKILGLIEAPFVNNERQRYFLIALTMNFSQFRKTGPEFSKIESKSSNDKFLLRMSTELMSADALKSSLLLTVSHWRKEKKKERNRLTLWSFPSSRVYTEL
jgi:hypothetical protein